MMMNSTEPKRSAFPSLPIINNPQAPSRSQREKYGTLFYLGILGLIVLVTLVGWFGYRVWSLRDVWAKIYVLNDAGEPEARRIQAAFSLGHDPRVEQRQLWDLSLRRGLPELARDILAEGIGPELVAEDPQGYVTAVARSPDWPGRWPTRRREDMRSLARVSASSAGWTTRFFASGLSTPLRFRPGPIPRPRSRSSASQSPRHPSMNSPSCYLPRFKPTRPAGSRSSTGPRSGTANITRPPPGSGKAGLFGRERWCRWPVEKIGLGQLDPGSWRSVRPG